MVKALGTWLVACCAGVVALGPDALSAQSSKGVQVRISPSLGISLPFGGPFVDEAFLEKNPVASAVLSGRIAVSAAPHFGLEASLAVGRGLVAVRDSLKTVRDHPATVFLASTRGLFQFNPPGWEGLSLHVGPGVGLIGRGGRAWVDTRPRRVVPALVAAAGVTASLGKRSPVRFRLELEDFISRAQFNVGLPTETRALLHHDLIWSLGLSFPILGNGL